MSAFRWTKEKLVIACQVLSAEWCRLDKAGHQSERKDEMWDLLCELTVELGGMRGENSAGTVGDLGGGLDNAPAKRRNPNAGKRKAAKRASKASKRAIMYREFGPRPWVDAHPADALRLPRSYRRRAIGHEAVMRELRKDSGFKQMSKIAEHFQTHEVTDVLNCGKCGGRGTWKDEKGGHLCLRCKGKGRVIYVKPQWLKYVPSADRYEREMRLREQVAGLYMEEAGRPE